MTNPDAAAAASFDPHPVQANALTHEHVGALVAARGTVGSLDDMATKDDHVHLIIRQAGRAFSSIVPVMLTEPVDILEPAPVSPHDEQANAALRTPEHIVWAREMAEIDDAIKSRNGEIVGLKERFAELSEKIMAYYEMAGDRKLPFDNRSANLRVDTYAQYRDRPASEGGGKYTNADVVQALRAIGREANIQPEAVNSSTLASILREYRDGDTPVPPELDALVELGEKPRVIITKPSPGRR